MEFFNLECGNEVAGLRERCARLHRRALKAHKQGNYAKRDRLVNRRNNLILNQ